MKRSFLCLLTTFFLAGSFAAAAQPEMTEITAVGTGSVSFAPDVATVRAQVQTNAASASDAVSENNAIYERIVAGLAKLGIARGDVALDYYNVRYYPRPQVAPANLTGEQYGYTVSRDFEVTVRKIAMAGTVTDASIGAGATSIVGIAFDLSDRTSARMQAITKAIADARANAETIARSVGLRIVSIKSIAYPENAYAVQPGMLTIGRVAAGRSVPTNLDQGNVGESATVRVVFLAGP